MEPEIYTIPTNIADNGGLLGGMIKKKNATEAVVAATIFFVLWLVLGTFLPGVIAKTITGTIFVFICMIILVGAKESSMLELCVEYYNFTCRKGKIYFRIPRREETDTKTSRRKK